MRGRPWIVSPVRLFRFVLISMLIALSEKKVCLVVIMLSTSVLGVISYFLLKSLSLSLGGLNYPCWVLFICLYIGTLSRSSTTGYAWRFLRICMSGAKLPICFYESVALAWLNQRRILSSSATTASSVELNLSAYFKTSKLPLVSEIGS